MAWLDLDAGILEEFAERQGAYVNATAKVAAFCSHRVAASNERNALWSAANPRRDAERKRAWYARAKSSPEVRAKRAEATAAWRARNPDREKARKRAQWQRRKAAA